jgi:hypothetical protein
MDVQLTETGCQQCYKITGKQWSAPVAQDSEERGVIFGYILVVFYVVYLLGFR